MRTSIPLLLSLFTISTGVASTTGYWRFETGPQDTAPGTLVDSSGNAHSGVPTSSPVYRSATPGGFPEDDNTLSLEFDGIDDVVEVAHSPTLSFDGSFTVEFWMKSPGTGAGQDLIIDKSHDFAGFSGWFFQSRPGVGLVDFGIGNGTGFPLITSLSEIFDDQWHHLAGTYSAGTIEFFIDGVSQGTLATGAYVNNTRPVRMGNTTNFNRYFKGHLDEVRISDEVLEVAEFLYEAPPKVYDPAIRLTFDQGNEYVPVWDPRGEIIAFSTDRNPGDWRDIGGVNADGSNERLLASGPQSPFGIATGDFSWIGESGFMTTGETVSFHEYLSFDVSKAPFTRTAINGADAAFSVLLGVDGGGGGGLFRVSRDESTVVWRYSSSGGNGRTTIRTAPFSSLSGQGASSLGTIHLDETSDFGTDQLFTQGGAISPDGSFIVIARNQGAGFDLWRFETDQSVAPMALTTSGLTSGAVNRLCEISPDGKTIAYSYFSGVVGETNEIFLMDVDGSNVRNLTQTPNISEANPTWSPDGKWLAYQRSDPAGSSFLVDGESPNSNIFKRPIDASAMLLELALVGTPHARMIELEGEEYFGMEFRRSAGGTTDGENIYATDDHIYGVEYSTDLENWQSDGSAFAYTVPVDHGDGTETVVVYLTEPGFNKRFLRLKIQPNCP